jgi:membrane-associated phospholipid phosphatase
MIALLAALPLFATNAFSTTDEPPGVVTTDGGTVPTVAPRATRKVAPLMAPEFVRDGGTEPTIAQPTLSVYEVDVPIEVAVTSGAVALTAVMDFLIKPSLQGDVSCRQPVGTGRCNPADLSSFDRYAVGRTSKEWTLFSDVALFSSVALPFLYLGLESLVLPTKDPWLDWGKDLLIVGEAMALASAFQMVLKFAVRRPRPVRYTDLEDPSTAFDAELSFPSGHTTLVAAATTAMTSTVFLRHPKSPVRFLWLISGILLTTFTGFARVESGHHFPTDVIVGALTGSIAGFLVPYVHRKRAPLVPTASVDPLTGATTLGVAGEL